MYDFIGASNQTLRGSTETPKNQDTAQSFQRTLQVGHCLIASGPADLSVGFCTVAIVTPRPLSELEVASSSILPGNESGFEEWIGRGSRHDNGHGQSPPGFGAALSWPVRQRWVFRDQAWRILVEGSNPAAVFGGKSRIQAAPGERPSTRRCAAPRDRHHRGGGGWIGGAARSAT